MVMKASIVDLRYKTADILKALDRNESVTVLYHGKVKGVIKPATATPAARVAEHPLFGSRKEIKAAVSEELEQLRKPRHAV